MPPGARRGARVLRVASQLVVDGLPALFVAHHTLVAALLLNFLVEEVKVN